MSRQDERERMQRRLGALTTRVGASRTGIAGAAEASRPLGGRRAHLVNALPAATRRSGGLRELARARLKEGPVRSSAGLAQGADRPADTGTDESRALSESSALRVRNESSADAEGGSDPRLGEWDVAANSVLSDSSGWRIGDEWSADGVRNVDQRPGEPSSGADGAPSRRAGRWDLAELPSEPADEDGDDDFGEVRSPGWLDEPAEGRGWRDRLVPERFRGIRLDPGRRGLCTLLVVGLVAMVVAAVVIFRERPVARPVPPLAAVRTTTTPAVARMSGAVPASAAASPGAAPVPTQAGGAAASPGDASVPAEPGAELVVSVVGLVRRTGLVRLPAGSRVADALVAAGGAQDGADLAGLNLAQRLVDGDQVLVGPPGPNPGPPQLGSATINAGARSSAAPSGSAHPTIPSGRVDLNTATESELEALPGIGPVMAKAIIAWRTAHGRFTDVTQLGQVDGIGPARLSRLRELVKV